MTLSHLLAVDKDALICDMAETYHIYDINAIPVSTLATLAAGLPLDSRVYQKEYDLKAPFSVVLEAAILDRLSLLLWAQSEDGVSGINKPESVASHLMIMPERETISNDGVIVFKNSAAFQAAYDQIHKQKEE
jgi:hypothetical protein